MAANLCCPQLPPAPPSTYPSCNYAAVAEGNLETVNKHGGRYGGPGTRPPTIKSLSGVGKTTVNWLFNHIVYVSEPVRVRRPERKQLPHPPSTLGTLLLLPPLQNYYYPVKSCKGSFKKVKTGRRRRKKDLHQLIGALKKKKKKSLLRSRCCLTHSPLICCCHSCFDLGTRTADTLLCLHVLGCVGAAGGAWTAEQSCMHKTWEAT